MLSAVGEMCTSFYCVVDMLQMISSCYPVRWGWPGQLHFFFLFFFSVGTILSVRKEDFAYKYSDQVRPRSIVALTKKLPLALSSLSDL